MHLQLILIIINTDSDITVCARGTLCSSIALISIAFSSFPKINLNVLFQVHFLKFLFEMQIFKGENLVFLQRVSDGLTYFTFWSACCSVSS